MVRNGQNHRHRIAVRKKTSASHRCKKLTIAEVYTSFSGKIINVFPPSQVLHHCHNLINAQQIAKRGCFDGEIAIYKFIEFSQNNHLIEPWQNTSIQVFTIQIYLSFCRQCMLSFHFSPWRIDALPKLYRLPICWWLRERFVNAWIISNLLMI